MRLKNLIVGGAVVLLFSAVFIQTSKNVSAATKTLNIFGNTFLPANSTVVVGDQILFENEDFVPHVLEIRRATDSGLIHTENFAAKTGETKDTYTRTFSVLGDFNLLLDTNVATGSVTVVQTTPSPSLTATPTVSPTSSPTVSPSVSPSVSATASPTVSPSLSPTASPTVTPSPTLSPSPTVTPTQSASPTPSPTVSPTASPTVVPTVSPTITPTASPSPTPTITPTLSPTPSTTVSPTVTPSPTLTPISSPTPTVAPTVTASPTLSPTPVPTLSPTPTVTSSPTVTASPTASPTVAPTVTPTPTVPPAPLPAVLPGFSVFRATTCAAQINTGNTQVLTDKVSSVYMTRGYWNVTSISPVNNGISLSAVLYQVQKINLFFGGNSFFGGNKVTVANEQATFVGTGVPEVLQKASAAWCLR